MPVMPCEPWAKGLLTGRMLSQGTQRSVSSWRNLCGLSACETADRVAREAEEAPLSQRPRAEFGVEIDRRLVPVEHGPFDAAAAALVGELGDAAQQGEADATAAVRGEHEQVFEVDAGFGE